MRAMSRKRARSAPTLARRPVEDAVFAARERGQFAGAKHDYLTSAAAAVPWWARGPPGLELERMLTLDETAELSGLSTDTLRRRYAHLIRRLSPRRVGMKLRDVLTIGTSEDSAPAA
jgi:hypothetical protein